MLPAHTIHKVDAHHPTVGHQFLLKQTDPNLLNDDALNG